MNTNSLATNLVRRDYFITESDFHNQLFKDIEEIIKTMESSSDKYYCDDEDKLSHTIVTSLGHFGYRATEQTKKNGSVDITVTTKTNGGEFVWIAEAKIGYGYQKIFEGLLQLLTRYIKRDNSGGLIIYYQKDKSNTLFNNWLKYLYKQEWTAYCTTQGNIKDVLPLLGHLNISSYQHVKDNCYYSDINVIKPTGANFDVRCFYVDVYHKPLDKSGVVNKTLKEGFAKNTIKDKYKLWEAGDFNSNHYQELFNALKIYFDGALDD
ncbi:hypothetical protein AD24_4177 [Escherichia coli 2-011-08_S4_C3]|nr:hypothetical protein AC66_4204 [Escherichia coli 2-011-08_S4_C1]KDT13344.1 hypothetical protein AD24_4177 [Escherichia coli 2-011-08_S4_C3]MXG05373.1 hypothetical protein [Escherichia coli]